MRSTGPALTYHPELLGEYSFSSGSATLEKNNKAKTTFNNLFAQDIMVDQCTNIMVFTSSTRTGVRIRQDNILIDF